MNESNTWEWLRDVALPLGQYSRIESPETAPGFPDVHYQIDMDCCGTLELKCNMRNAKIPFPDTEKGLHVSQLSWIRKNLERWGNIWIIAETPNGIHIIHGSEYEEFNGATRDELLHLSVAVVHRDDPENATKILHNLLTTWRYDK